MTGALDGTEWRVMVVAGEPALDTVQPTIRFEDGALFGTGSINRYRGSYTQDGSTLGIGPVMSTLMAGPEDAMRQEHRWTSALRESATMRMDGEVLVLSHLDGTESRLVPVGPFVSVSGTVAYRERIAMPPGAEITVTLEDTSRADAASIRVAQQIIRDPGNVPVPFELEVDRSRVPERGSLSLRARIDVEGKLRWTTDVHHTVDLDAEPQAHALLLRQVGG